MFRTISILLCVLFSTYTLADTTKASTDATIATPFVTLKTNKGDIVLELNPVKAPISVANFLNYVEDGYYNNTVFHRVIPEFMIQGGGFTDNMVRKPTKDAIKNEADNGLFNNRGTIAMARMTKVDSATSQFFINLKNNYFLNNGQRDFGYAVFGKVTKGLDIVDAIAMVNTQTHPQSRMQNVPVEPIIVESASVSYNKP